MPELPEVETVRLTLEPILRRAVTSVWTSALPLRGVRLPQREFEAALVGNRVSGLRRWGKYLLIDFAKNDVVLVVHLGMSGRLRIIESAEAKVPHTHLVCSLSGRGRRMDLRYSDPRRFGQVSLAKGGAEKEHASLAKLGVDPLTP